MMTLAIGAMFAAVAIVAFVALAIHLATREWR